jgi:hypothetical protein
LLDTVHSSLGSLLLRSIVLYAHIVAPKRSLVQFLIVIVTCKPCGSLRVPSTSHDVAMRNQSLRLAGEEHFKHFKS